MADKLLIIKLICIKIFFLDKMRFDLLRILFKLLMLAPFLVTSFL